MTKHAYTPPFLPPVSDENLVRQIHYCRLQQWRLQIEHTSDPRAKNIFWHGFGLTMMDDYQPADIVREINACKQAYPNHAIRLNGIAQIRGINHIKFSLLVHNPQINQMV